jgi:hypothetical protein
MLKNLFIVTISVVFNLLYGSTSAGTTQQLLVADGNNLISFRDSFSMPMAFVNDGTAYFEQVNMVFGANSDSTTTGTTIPMLPDLGFNRIMVGSLPDLGWGIKCDQTTNCNITSDPVESCVRLGATSTCRKITTYLRFRNQSLSLNTPKLSFDMMTTQDGWNPKGEGIIGLGPQSPIWGYLKSAYDTNRDTVDISLFYRANELSGLISLANNNYKNAVMVVNGKGIAVDPFFVNYTESNLSMDNWIMTSVNFSRQIDGKITDQQENICVNNEINFTLAVQNYSTYHDSIFKQLCGSTSGCTNLNSDLKNVSKFYFTLYNQTDQDSRFQIDLRTEELINFDANGNAYLLIGDINEYQKYPNVCKGASVILGKYFLASRELVIRYNKIDGSFLIGFHSFEPSLVFLIILLVLATLIFTIFVIVCVYSIVDKARKYSQTQYVNQAENLYDDSKGNAKMRIGESS